MSIASSADFFVNFLVVLLFLPDRLVPRGTYWIYCGFGVLAVLFTVRFLHETSGRELEEMEEVAR